MWRLPALCVLLLYAAFASAAGFDNRFVLRVGDFESDNDLDIFASASPIVVPLDDIPIVIGPPVSAFLLRNVGGGNFSVKSDLTPAQMAAMRTWPESVIPVSFADVNYDGAPDLTIRDPGISGMRGQIAFANWQHNRPPMHIRALD